MISRRAMVMGLGGVLTAGIARVALAHHGWRWTEDGNFELTGVITAVRLGNPHGVLEVDAEDEAWIVEVGQPYRHARAGLADALLAPGVEIIASGGRSADHAENRMKAERITIAGVLYNLYPDRS